MAITQVGGTETNSTTGATSLAINKPADVAVGDLLTAGLTSDGTAPTAPAGWTEFGGVSHGSASWNIHLYYRFVTGAEGSNFSWTIGNVGPAAGFINAWRGVDQTTPIDDFEETQSVTESEPATGPSITAVSAIGRMFYVRAVRDAPGGGTAVAADLTEAVAGVSRRTSVGGVSASGNTAYTIGHFSADSSHTTSGVKTGLAISCSPSTEDHNYEATYALRASNDGTLTSTLPSVTSDFDGQRVPNSGSLTSSLPSVSADADGVHYVPSTGPIEATLPSISAAVEGFGEAGGVIDASFVITAQFVVETRQFGEHVILVEPEHRAFLVVDDGTDTGLKPIKRSRVTQE